MRFKTSILSFFVLCVSFCFAQTNQHTIVEKTISGFQLSIYLPPGYDTVKGCKVLYFNDGQTVFGEYGLNADAMADELISKKLIDPIIIIGIHSDANRTSNYLPYPDEGAKQNFGNYQPNADNYTKQITRQIIPYIEKHYKTKQYNGIAGYSFGGLHATWTALNYPGR